MNESTSNQPNVEFLKALHGFIRDEQPQQPVEQIEARLKSQGVDLDKTLAQIRKKATQAENRLRLQSLTAGVEYAATCVRGHAYRTIEELREAVKAVVSQMPEYRPASAFYSKLETATENDLESLLVDFEELTSSIDGNERSCEQSQG
jgi:maltooligosyltrehalose synthase